MYQVLGERYKCVAGRIDSAFPALICSECSRYALVWFGTYVSEEPGAENPKYSAQVLQHKRSYDP